MRIIDADALICKMEKVLRDGYGYRDLFDAVKNAPTIDAVHYGRWIKDRLVSTNGGAYGVYRCSICEHCYQDIGYGFNYCPNCGAIMTEK